MYDHASRGEANSGSKATIVVAHEPHEVAASLSQPDTMTTLPHTADNSAPNHRTTDQVRSMHNGTGSPFKGGSSGSTSGLVTPCSMTDSKDQRDYDSSSQQRPVRELKNLLTKPSANNKLTGAQATHTRSSTETKAAEVISQPTASASGFHRQEVFMAPVQAQTTAPPGSAIIHPTWSRGR